MKALSQKFNLNSKLTTLSLLNYVWFFLPIIKLAAQSEQNIFKFSCLKILTHPQFIIYSGFNSHTLQFPHYTRILIGASILFHTIAVLLTFYKSFKLAASFFITATLCPLSVFPAINEIQTKLIELKISSNKIFIEFTWFFLILELFGLACAILSLKAINLEHLINTIFLFFSIFTTTLIIFITTYMIILSLPAIKQIGFFNLILKSKWHPATNEFGILNLIKASIFSTLGATLIATPVGILTAIFMVEMCNKKLLWFLQPLVELLAGIPSVIFGFFAMNTITPTIKTLFTTFQNNNNQPIVGDSMLAVIIVLTIMILPTIINTAVSALHAVPIHLKEASLSLGANKIETIFKICLPTAKNTIMSGISLAIGRAIGETMAVIMVAGNIANPPRLLGTVRLLTTGIALDLSYACGLLKSVLFAIGLVLLILITIINLTFNLLCKKGAFLSER